MSSSLDSLCLWTSWLLRRQLSKSIKTILALSITGFCGKAEKSMQPEPRRPGPSLDWLRYARADLALARVPLPQGGLYELLCFHAQQAATDRKNKRHFRATTPAARPPAALASGHTSPRALAYRPARHSGLAGAPQSQAEHGAV
jgi:HEPN domain